MAGVERVSRLPIVAGLVAACLVVAAACDHGEPGAAAPSSSTDPRPVPSFLVPKPAPVACVADEDCAVVAYDPGGKTPCCTCVLSAALRHRAEAIEAECRASGPPVCILSCLRSGPETALCRDGRCVLHPAGGPLDRGGP